MGSQPNRRERMAEEDSFKPGDLVVIRSGGPVMTVTQCAEDQLGMVRVTCSWFDKNAHVEGIFPAPALKTYEGN
jgi:uncharacterized protein YodC (DUF2158 family)